MNRLMNGNGRQLRNDREKRKKRQEKSCECRLSNWKQVKLVTILSFHFPCFFSIPIQDARLVNFTVIFLLKGGSEVTITLSWIERIEKGKWKLSNSGKGEIERMSWALQEGDKNTTHTYIYYVILYTVRWKQSLIKVLVVCEVEKLKDSNFLTFSFELSTWQSFRPLWMWLVTSVWMEPSRFLLLSLLSISVQQLFGHFSVADDDRDDFDPFSVADDDRDDDGALRQQWSLAGLLEAFQYVSCVLDHLERTISLCGFAFDLTWPNWILSNEVGLDWKRFSISGVMYHRFSERKQNEMSIIFHFWTVEDKSLIQRR